MSAAFETRGAIEHRLNAIPADAQLRLVPVRHHSPACAKHLQTLIEKDQPELILIEGPADATPLLEFLADEDAKPPLALYFYYCEKSGDWLSAATGENSATRHRGFYPLAEFSPEWVAIRSAASVSAEVRFIDLPYAYRLPDIVEEQNSSHESSLLDDQELAGADHLKAIVEKSGCRDFNEWWDRYCESGAMELDAAQYFRELLGWCLFTRATNNNDTAQDVRHNDAREAYMASQIQEAVKTGKRVMVITGGYHTEAIAQLLLSDDALPSTSTPPLQGEQGLYIVPYTLGRLDAANGYAAGISNTSYYQEVWQQHSAGQQHPHQGAAQTIALRVSTALRDRGELVSMPDCIEAISMSRRLGALRQVAPGRSEILDAMASAFIKDSISRQDSEHLERLFELDLKGKVPARYPAAPLAEDFRNQCVFFKLPTGPNVSAEKRLDIYRSEKHRQVSRLLHRVNFLHVPYAQLNAGPDFAAGTQLHRVREVWDCSWSPETDAVLTERMAYGSQLEEAAANYLFEQLEDQLDAAPRLLIEALKMGLHRVLDRIVERVAQWIDTESGFPKLIHGLKLLTLAYSAQNALAARQLPALHTILSRCFERACLRLTWLGDATDDASLEYVVALSDLNALARKPLSGQEDGWADVALFERCVDELYKGSSNTALRGCAAGILTARQIWAAECTEQALTNAFNEAYNEPHVLGDYLSGFLPMARAFLIQAPALIRSMNAVIDQWDEDVFLDALPTLRLAFTVLKPREAAAIGTSIGIEINELNEARANDVKTVPAKCAVSGGAGMRELEACVRKSLKLWGMAT